MEHQTTFLDLVTNKVHWEFEIFLMVIFDGIIGLLIWPYINKFLLHHKSDDERIKELERKVEELSQNKTL